MSADRVVEHAQNRFLIAFGKISNYANAFEVAAQRGLVGRFLVDLAHRFDAKQFISGDAESLSELDDHVGIGVFDFAFVVRYHALRHARSFS